MGEFHNVIVAVIDEKGEDLIEHIEQLVFHVPAFVLWGGAPSKSDFGEILPYNDFIPAAHNTIYIGGGCEGHIVYDKNGSPSQIKHLNDYLGKNLYRGVSFTRQPFTKNGNQWSYNPKIIISNKFHQAEFEVDDNSPREGVYFVGVFHILLPKFYIPHTLSLENFDKQQGLLYVKKHEKIKRISLTWGFYKDVDLTLQIEKSKESFMSFDEKKYIQPSVAQKFQGMAKATKDIVTNDKLGLVELVKKIVLEGVFTHKWFF